MPSLHPVHGGTDSLPDPHYDFSSNANPLGPCPWALAAVRSADVTRYPDPAYTELRTVLACASSDDSRSDCRGRRRE